MKRLHDEHVKETSEGKHPFILYNDQDNEETNNSKDLKNMIIKSILKQDGGLISPSHRETCGIQHLRPRQLSGNSTTSGSRTEVGILGDSLPGVNSCVFFCSEMLFRLPESEFPGNRRGV